ncbi:MAG TPA: HNH endonuclease, partial [Pyrinomonadaceae bacterium]|nr:HNH endonuclease [Pyrinomonadaceae bacterium]
LMWCMHFDEWPNQIDHRDLNKTNDEIGNLRPCTDGQNKANTRRRATSTSGYKGVQFHKPSGLWHSRIQVEKKRLSLGYFRDPALANEAYAAAAKTHYGEFARN